MWRTVADSFFGGALFGMTIFGVWPNVVETVGSVLEDRATRTAPATGAE